MPRSAWVEIRDAGGALLVSIPAQIKGGTVRADLPAFPPNTQGSIELFTDPEEEPDRGPPEVKELPTTAQTLIVQIG
jgi:hypothetical protein